MADRPVLEKLSGFGLATVMARKGVAARDLQGWLGGDVPATAGWSRSAAVQLIGTGPGTWLAWREEAGAEWFAGLRSTLRGFASLSDQSSGYVIYKLCGQSARTLLQRGACIDLHPDAFRTGSAATINIAHIGVILWQQDDAPTFHIALFRSFAASFEHWFDSAVQGL